MEDLMRKEMRDLVNLKLLNGATLPDAVAEVRELLGSRGMRDRLPLLEQVAEELRIEFGEFEELSRHSVLEEGKGKGRPWYTVPSEDYNSCWQTYVRSLQARGRTRAEIGRIDRETSLVMSRLAPPAGAPFRKQGLVVGHVQSGKTANMIGLVAKAADAGYRNFLVLSGITEDLRKQTQRRFVTDLGLQNPAMKHRWVVWSREEGDFDAGAPGCLLGPSGHWNLAVVKKNHDVLNRFLDALRNSTNAVVSSGWLVIDDECDNASINIKYTRDEIATINRRIREILNELERVVYVGYTATPYANLLIDPRDPENFPDLYPKDFIISLEKSPEYQGPEIYFGSPLEVDEAGDRNTVDAVRFLSADEEKQARSWGRKDGSRPEMIESLERALDWFLLASAARQARNGGPTNTTCLIHVSHQIDVHEAMAGLIGRWLEDARRRWASGDPAFRERLRRLWEEETSRVRAEELGKEPVPRDATEQQLQDVLRRARLKVLNSESSDQLEYEKGDACDIVIGGNKLSRGLTLEGLVSSFFTRFSRQYDTLMQMGRWFGYRPCYEDLPRIWTTASIFHAFAQLVQVEEEMRQEMKVFMEDEKVTPRNYAVRIRRSPGLLITSRYKMGAARVCNVGYSGRHLQTRRFWRLDREWLQNNLAAMADVLMECQEAVGEPDVTSGGRVYREVPAKIVQGFLKRYDFHEAHEDMRREDLLRRYIAKHAGDDGSGALGLWNVVLVEPPGARGGVRSLPGVGEVKKVVRARLKSRPDDPDADIKALMSRADVLLDLPEEERGKLLDRNAHRSWEIVKRERQRWYEKTLGHAMPELLLYLIDSTSPPGRGGQVRLALDAVEDVAAVGIVFPFLGDEEHDYVSVTLESDEVDAESEDE